MKVTLWLDYRTEGWHPKEFPTVEEALEAIKTGQTFGQPFRLTHDLDLAAEFSR